MYKNVDIQKTSKLQAKFTHIYEMTPI